jgi:hypothetical protein
VAGIHVSQVRLNELGTGMNVNLPQNSFTRVNESVRRVRWNDDDAAGFHRARFISYCDSGGPFNCERDLDVRMLV